MARFLLLFGGVISIVLLNYDFVFSPTYCPRWSGMYQLRDSELGEFAFRISVCATCILSLVCLFVGEQRTVSKELPALLMLTAACASLFILPGLALEYTFNTRGFEELTQQQTTWSDTVKEYVELAVLPLSIVMFLAVAWCGIRRVILKENSLWWNRVLGTFVLLGVSSVYTAACISFIGGLCLCLAEPNPLNDCLCTRTSMLIQG